MSDQPTIAIVIVNWNGKTDTLACLDSLSKLSYPKVRTLVVDNGSTDGSVTEIQSLFPEAETLELGFNAGFAAGSNAGIRQALKNDADMVLLLNNDTTVEPELLAKLVSATQAIGTPALLGPAIYSSSSPSQIWAAGARMAPSGVALELVTTLTEFTAGNQETVEVDALVGSALLVDRRIFESVGVLDADFFAYWEDFDFCSRARAAGYRCYVVPRARVWHQIGASLGNQSAVRAYYDARNRLVWAHRHLAGPAFARRPKAILWILSHFYIPPVRPCRDNTGVRTLIFNLMLFGPRFIGRCLHPMTRAALRGVWDYLRGRLGPAPPSIRRLDEQRSRRTARGRSRRDSSKPEVSN